MDSRVETNLIGTGLYTVPEAARLVHAPVRSIHRWLRGYSYRRGNEPHSVGPLWRGDLEPVDGTIALSFYDLLEARMVAAFRRRGVSWPAIRLAARRAEECLQSHHPFILQAFKTDGQRIFAEIREAGEVRLFDLNKAQYALRDVVAQSLFRGIEFEDNHPIRWYPSEGNGRVVVDPERSFGRPVIERSGVPTEVLAQAVSVEESIERVAYLYEVDSRDVRDAVEFEQRLVA